MAGVVRIGNAQGFWGDSPGAPARLVSQAPDLDYLTLDYLAEVSMSILAKQRQRDPAAGYPRDFLEVIDSLARFWRAGRRFRLVTNAGGLSPRGCADAAATVLRNAGCRGLKIGVVSGDDVLPLLRAAGPEEFRHLETGHPLGATCDTLVTANAYLGAAPVTAALAAGADIVITGRVADPSLTVAPCIHHFGWRHDDYDRIAGATVAGHLIECGTQVTGGISTHWLDLPGVAHLGYPLVEVADDGSCVVTQPEGSGGRVDERSVKEQLLYEIGDPDNYLSPDATVSFLSLAVEDLGGKRVRVGGATGRPPPGSYKVSATYPAGFRAAGTLTIIGRDAAAKGHRCARALWDLLHRTGSRPRRFHHECLGAGEILPADRPPSAATEVVLRIAVADERRDVVERFTREFSALITAGPQGTTGYAEGRPPVREVFAYWPTLIDRAKVRPVAEVFEI